MSVARYPRPKAPQEGVGRVIALYKEQYDKDLTEEEARNLLEGVMQFVYLTQVLPQFEEAGLTPKSSRGEENPSLLGK